jgi:hypothetical protein
VSGWPVQGNDLLEELVIVHADEVVEHGEHVQVWADGERK